MKNKFKAPDVGVVFEYNGNRYRVNSWLKKIDIPQSEHWIDKILFESVYQRNSKKFVWCSREEAMYVSGSGVCGCLVSLDKIKIVGKVTWTKKILTDHRKHAIWLIGKMVR